MTEISKNSRNNRADTVSNTGGHSGQVQSYPYNGQVSETPQKESGNNSFNINGYNQDHLQSPEDNFDVAIKDILPMISSIKEQNEYFKHQKKTLQTQLSNLHKLSSKLLLQNQQLRKHHSMRTQDIKKIIDTISINTNEEINDINHQAFLIKESNHLIVKKIQQKMKANNEVVLKLQEKKRQLQRATVCNINLKENQRDLQIKNKQLFYRCEQLKNEVKKEDSNEDLGDINDLIIEVTNLKNQNKGKLLKARTLVNSHRQERPKFQENHQHIVDQMKGLEAEAKGLRETAESSEQRLAQIKVVSEQSQAKGNQARRLYEKITNNEVQKRQQIAKLKSEVVKTNKKVNNSEAELQKVKKEKETIIESIQNKKQLIKKGEEKFSEQKIRSEAALKQQSKKMKETLNMIISKANEQIQSKLAPQSSKVTESINTNRQQYASLVQEVGQLDQKVKRLDNPIKQIIKLEYQLKKGKRL